MHMHTSNNCTGDSCNLVLHNVPSFQQSIPRTSLKTSVSPLPSSEHLKIQSKKETFWRHFFLVRFYIQPNGKGSQSASSMESKAHTQNAASSKTSLLLLAALRRSMVVKQWPISSSMMSTYKVGYRKISFHAIA